MSFDQDSDGNLIQEPIEGETYLLDGNPEVQVTVSAVFPEEKVVDAVLTITLPTGSEFISVQFYFYEDGYSNSFFQCTYRTDDGYVVSRTYYLYENDRNDMTILDGEWAIGEDVIHRFKDKHTQS